MVTAAVGEPAAFGGVAPGGASAGIPGVFAGVGVFLAVELLAVFEHEAAKSEVIKIAIKANGRPILGLFVLIVYQLKKDYFTARIRFSDAEGFRSAASVASTFAAMPSASRPYWPSKTF